MSVHTDLIAARALIAKGWIQGCAREDDRYCSVGAIWYSTGSAHDPSVNFVRDNAAQRVLQGLLGGRDIVDWNDVPGRTQEEVLELFDRAIAATAPDNPYAHPEAYLPLPEVLPTEALEKIDVAA